MNTDNWTAKQLTAAGKAILETLNPTDSGTAEYAVNSIIRRIVDLQTENERLKRKLTTIRELAS